ncbi:MAG: GDSL-type esterase/lipase family protein [Planctomycetota bacterium]
MSWLRPGLLFLATAIPAWAAPQVDAPLALRDGDSVALVGNAFFERAQRSGHLETALLLAGGADSLRVRNLGWSGDSVFGDARSYFGPPSEGRDRLQKAVAECAPQVVLLCYGSEVALTVGRPWTGEPGAADRSAATFEDSVQVFVEGYGQLIDAVRKAAGDGLREIVLVTPPPFEQLGAPLPDMSDAQARLEVVRRAILDLATARGVRGADLFTALSTPAGTLVQGEEPRTSNGIHHTDAGYRRAAAALAQALGLALPSWWDGQGDMLEALRQVVVQKNRLFFHRWRPANETYLFLFRKHEQGQNAKEIPMFDPLIQEAEVKVEALRRLCLEGKGDR